MGKNRQNKGVEQTSKFDGIFMVYACDFSLRPLLEVILYRCCLLGHTGCQLSEVERCPLLGGSKCTISIGRAIGVMEFVRCTEVVRLSESLLLEVSLYKYKETAQFII